MFVRLADPREITGTVGMYVLRVPMMAIRPPNKSDRKNVCNLLASLTQPVIIYPDKT